MNERATGKDQPSDYQALVEKTHTESLKARERVLRDTIARDTSWPDGVWGEVLWSLAALYLNEKLDEANARLLKRAREYAEIHRAQLEVSDFTLHPLQPGAMRSDGTLGLKKEIPSSHSHLIRLLALIQYQPLIRIGETRSRHSHFLHHRKMKSGH